ncbi:hypothetical protein Pmani_016980 [Petrolisthes manimaculis]|uniref:RanBP2-type domain-containing protein n=1 Tax=Petrolisthes manimaculis TaxID=1843537 RepID=A0AAE1PR36_9EUCA|nr:hypothetical protein Pmani_016980 [Petrolisthes manimaculis]
MYHMAMPPHMGGPHPPTVHSPLFPSPILPPPMPHSYAMHAFPTSHLAAAVPTSHSPQQQHQQQQHSSVAAAAAGAANVTLPVGTGNSAMLTHPSPMLSQPSPVYPSQTSVYVNPYLGPTLPHTHAHPHPPHQHPPQLVYGMPTGVGVGPPPGLLPPQQSSGQTSGPPPPPGPVMSVDEELMEEMSTLHLGYIETEDSPHKLEQREKLERVIMEYLAITPHSHKFIFHQISDVLESSINRVNDFSAYSAACAFDALAQYAANLIAQPWRREFRQIKLYSGFWVHQVSRRLLGAESILSLMGYAPCPTLPNSTRPDSSFLVLEGVLDPDLISRLALDCLIAYCECQVMKKISEGVREFGLSYRQILQYRQLHVGGVDVTVRHLLFTLRQRLHPQVQPEVNHRQTSTSSTTGPPLPVRKSSVGGTSSSPSSLSAPHQPTPPTHSSQDKSGGDQQRTNMGGVSGGGGGSSGGEQRGNSYHHHHHHHMGHHPTTTSSQGPNHSPLPPPQPPAPPASYSRSADTPDTGKSLSSVGVVPGGQVPTAKLIDLDSSHEALAPRPSHLLPKVLPHKRSVKVPGPGNRVLPPLDTSEATPPPPPPPEVFQAGTLDEHLEATLSLVKDPNRNSATLASPNDQGATSWETWDFVYRGLEKRGYNKDIGDRGDILHQITRQNLYSEAVAQGKNTSLNNKKDMTKSKPLSINQALQALALNETRERVERPPPSSKSSYSASHGAGPDVFPNLTKRNSLYDNISAGFETAPQDSDDYEDRKPPLKKTSNLSRVDNRLDPANKMNVSSSSSPRSMSSKGSHSRHDIPSENSRSSATVPTLQPTTIPPTITMGGSDIWPRDSQQTIRENIMSTPWSCTTCTFLNDKGRTACDMCGKSKMPGPEVKPLISGGRQCPQCTLINEREAMDCSACGVHLEGSSTYI